MSSSAKQKKVKRKNKRKKLSNVKKSLKNAIFLQLKSDYLLFGLNECSYIQNAKCEHYHITNCVVGLFLLFFTIALIK